MESGDRDWWPVESGGTVVNCRGLVLIEPHASPPWARIIPL